MLGYLTPPHPHPPPPGGSLSSGPAVAGGSAENREEGHSFPGPLGKAAGWLAPHRGSLFQTFFPPSQLFIPAVIIVACVPSSLPVFLLMCVLMGFSVATIFLLPW